MLAGDDDPVRRDAVAAPQVGDQLAQGCRDLFDLGALGLGGGAWLHGLAAAVEKFDPDMLFDLLDAAREGRLRQVSPFGAAAERPGLRDRQDILQPLKPHGIPQVAISARYCAVFAFAIRIFLINC